MPCLLLIGVLFPRAALVLMFLLTNWIGRAVDGLIIPLLGFFFLPYTLLWYVAVMNLWGYWGFWQIAFMVLAVLFDLSSHGGSARAARRR